MSLFGINLPHSSATHQHIYLPILVQRSKAFNNSKYPTIQSIQSFHRLYDTMGSAWQPPLNYLTRPVTVLGAGVLGRRIGKQFL